MQPGSVAPEFEAFTLYGNPVGLEQFSGRVLLLNIWATWCPPCREEIPSMERLYRHFQEQGSDFEIVAVSIDAAVGDRDPSGGSKGGVAAFVEEYGLTFTILRDPSGKIQETYRTTGVPESFLIGADGIIYQRISGATNWDADAYREAVHRLFSRMP